MKPVIVITGPTATGKSALGVQVAKRIDGEIISCDSMQIYRHMDVGTAKITAAEMQGIPHHMIDIVDPNQEYSVACFQQQATQCIRDIQERGKVALLVGGTGLYMQSVLYPMQFKQFDPAIRSQIEREYELSGKQAMYDKLCDLSPQMAAKLYPNDVKRVSRALELVYSGQQHNTQDRQKACIPHCLFVLHDDRQALYERINVRVDHMVQAGLKQEVQGLLDADVSRDSQSFAAIAYKEYAACLAGEMNEEQTIELIKRRSRNYCKRQLTWFRQYPQAVWLNCNDPSNVQVVCDAYKESTHES